MPIAKNINEELCHTLCHPTLFAKGQMNREIERLLDEGADPISPLQLSGSNKKDQNAFSIALASNNIHAVRAILASVKKNNIKIDLNNPIVLINSNLSTTNYLQYALENCAELIRDMLLEHVEYESNKYSTPGAEEIKNSPLRFYGTNPYSSSVEADIVFNMRSSKTIDNTVHTDREQRLLLNKYLDDWNIYRDYSDNQNVKNKPEKPQWGGSIYLMYDGGLERLFYLKRKNLFNLSAITSVGNTLYDLLMAMMHIEKNGDVDSWNKHQRKHLGRHSHKVIKPITEFSSHANYDSDTDYSGSISTDSSDGNLKTDAKTAGNEVVIPLKEKNNCDEPKSEREFIVRIRMKPVFDFIQKCKMEEDAKLEEQKDLQEKMLSRPRNASIDELKAISNSSPDGMQKAAINTLKSLHGANDESIAFYNDARDNIRRNISNIENHLNYFSDNDYSFQSALETIKVSSAIAGLFAPGASLAALAITKPVTFLKNQESQKKSNAVFSMTKSEPLAAEKIAIRLAFELTAAVLPGINENLDVEKFAKQCCELIKKQLGNLKKCKGKNACEFILEHTINDLKDVDLSHFELKRSARKRGPSSGCVIT